MVMNEMEVIRYITQYSAFSEQLVEEHPLIGFNTLALQKELSVTEKINPMYDCYSINCVNTEFLRKYLENDPARDFKKFIYFLEA